MSELDVAPEGLRYREDFLTVDEESALAGWLDAQPWDLEISRRRQFYGGGYQTHTETVPLPEPLESLTQRLLDEGLVSVKPDRCLINEYLPGQGIAAHIDYFPDFNAEVVTISLLDAYPMLFARKGEEYEKWLARRSVCVMTGPCRYEWTHEIAKRVSDFIPGGGRRKRGRRVSITFRKRTQENEEALNDKRLELPAD